MTIQYDRPTMDLKKERQLDGLRADKEQLEATLEYVAMMADVDIWEDDDNDDEQVRG